jgi:hypothetical protein
MSPFPPGSRYFAFGGPDTLPSENDGTVSGGGPHPHQPGERDIHPRASLPAGGSLAFQTLYANDAVKQAFASLDQPSVVLYSGSDDDDEDDDWEDRMDSLGIMRLSIHTWPGLSENMIRRCANASIRRSRTGLKGFDLWPLMVTRCRQECLVGNAYTYVQKSYFLCLLRFPS